MPPSHPFDADQLLDRIVTALRDEPIPEFHDPLAGNQAGTTADDECAEGLPADQRAPAPPAGPRSRPGAPVLNSGGFSEQTIEPTGARRAGRWAGLARRWRLLASCVAAALLVAAAGLALRPQASFAEVQAAVQRQPWIHVRTLYADQSTSEAWFSPGRNISASRGRGAVRYDDFRLQVYYSYDPQEQVLYRAPIAGRTSAASEFESIGQGIKLLLQGDGPPEKPLTHLGFLGPEREKLTVLDQSVEKFIEQDRSWLDYRLTVKHAELAEPVRLLFRVDTRTKLPQFCRAEALHDGQLLTFNVKFDYPEKGPADIYELGVPEETKLVDRVPAGDLKLIVETIEAGRERMDNYSSVFVTQHDGMDQGGWGAFPEVFYRKGDRYRRDFVVAGSRGDGTKPPAGDADLRDWWFERAKQFRYYPIGVQLGQTAYTCNITQVVDPDGSEHSEIDAVHKSVYNLKPGELFPVDYVMRPEFVCRPPMGIGNLNQEPTLDLHPAEGPDGCILLTVAHTTQAGRINENAVGPADGNRYWLDPRRDFIALRWEMVNHDGNGNEIISHSHIVEETARSPQGVWYATKVRLKNASTRQSDGKQFDVVYHIYVDFEAELPDELFQPPTPRRIE